MRELADRILATAIVLLIAGMVLRCAWQIVRPLAPGLVVIALAAFLVKWLHDRQGRW